MKFKPYKLYGDFIDEWKKILLGLAPNCYICKTNLTGHFMAYNEPEGWLCNMCAPKHHRGKSQLNSKLSTNESEEE